MLKAFISWGPRALFVFLFAASILGKGIPALRHDWFWPITRLGLGHFWTSFVSGWIGTGFGYPNAYPASYLLASAETLVALGISPLGSLWILTLGTGAVVVQGASYLGRRLGNVATISPAWFVDGVIPMIALFNPWVYNQSVAGHIGMILGYGALMMLLADAIILKVDSLKLVVLFILILPQIQFALVALVVIAAISVVKRSYRALIACLLITSPVLFGILGSHYYLSAVPFLSTWQFGQSIPIAEGFGLHGYFAGYDARFASVYNLCMYPMLVALVVAFAKASRTTTRCVLAFGCLCAIAASGLRGPVASLYGFLIVHIHALGVYRELYDLLAFLGIAYLIACVIAGAGKRWFAIAVRYGACLVAVAYGCVWLIAPPLNWFVGAASLPAVPERQATERVILLPAFQPMSYNGAGSGYDPRLWQFPGAINPLLGYQMTYPVDAAVGAYIISRDGRDLASLGVSECIGRPRMETAGVALREQRVYLQDLGANTCGGKERAEISSPTALFQVLSAPRTVIYPPRFSDDALFFSDSPRPVKGRQDPWPPMIFSANATGGVDPKKGWVDASSVFAAHPNLGQGIGGAYTESTLPYKVAPGGYLLAWMRGSLESSAGQVLVSANGSYRWLSLTNVRAVRCSGQCMLVLENRYLPTPYLPVGIHGYGTVKWREVTPFIRFVEVRHRGRSVLKMNERYSPAWVAMSRWKPLEHIRLGSSINGWALDGAPSETILLFDWVAVVQAVLELAGAVMAIVVLMLYMQRAIPPRRDVT